MARSHLQPGRLTGLLVCLSLGAGLGLGGLAARAGGDKVVFQFYPALFVDMPETVKCPQTLTAIETMAPYREGSYAWSGSADFRAFAGPFKILRQDPFTVVWQADLKAPYRQCQGTAAPKGDDQGDYGHLGMRFLKGKVELVLDMTGKPDANQYTAGISYAKVKDGMPIWGCEGSD